MPNLKKIGHTPPFSQKIFCAHAARTGITALKTPRLKENCNEYLFNLKNGTNYLSILFAGIDLNFSVDNGNCSSWYVLDGLEFKTEFSECAAQ